MCKYFVHGTKQVYLTGSYFRALEALADFITAFEFFAILNFKDRSVRQCLYQCSTVFFWIVLVKHPQQWRICTTPCSRVLQGFQQSFLYVRGKYFFQQETRKHLAVFILPFFSMCRNCVTVALVCKEMGKLMQQCDQERIPVQVTVYADALNKLFF